MENKENSIEQTKEKKEEIVKIKNIDDLKKKIPEVPDTNSGKYVKIGLTVLFIVFGIFGIWSAFAPLDSGVPLGGRVISEANNKIIQNLEGGVVEKIYVDSGDHVKKGDMLVKLSEARYISTLLSLEANYYEALAKESRLMAENKNMKYIKFSKELDKLDPKRRKNLIKAQIEIFKNDISSLDKNRKIAAQKIESFNTQINGIRKAIKIKEKLLESYKAEAKEQQELFDEQLINKTKLREVKRRIDTILSDILSDKTNIENIKIKIDETKTKLSLQERDFYGKIKQELRKVQTSIEDIRAKMISTKDRIKRTAVRSPVNGVVLNMRVHTIGAVIGAGKPMMEIVPDNSRLIIEAKLQPRYIDYVKVGSKANMTFPAFQMKGKFIHNIEGRVIYVSADSLADKKGRSFYTVKLVVDKEGEKILKKEHLSIMAGMPASVTIKFGKQTLLEYLFKPMTLMVHKAFLEE